MHPSEAVRTIDNMMDPDVRSAGFGTNGETLVSRVDAISAISLSERIPERVRIQFETAKNLFVYSWFVYRFHGVARQQLFGTLEFALKVRLYPTRVGQLKSKERGLTNLLTKANDLGLLQNTEFTRSEQLPRGVPCTATCRR